MSDFPVTQPETRLFWEWQGRVTQALEHLKIAVEKIEKDRATNRDYENLAQKVADLQKSINKIPQIIQQTVKEANETAEKAFDKRLQDLGIISLRSDMGLAQQDVATLKEATDTLKKTAIRYGLLGGGVPAGLALLGALLYWLITGESPP